MAAGKTSVVADVCLYNVVVLDFQLLVQAKRAGALHGREHIPVQVVDIQFRLQEGLDGSGIRTLRVESSLRRPVQVQDVRFRLQEGLDGSGIRTLRLKLSLRRPVHIHDIRFRLQESLDGSSMRTLRVELSHCLPVLL